MANAIDDVLAVHGGPVIVGVAMKGPKGLRVGSRVISVYSPKTGTVEGLNHAWAWVRPDGSDKVVRIDRTVLKVVAGDRVKEAW